MIQLCGVVQIDCSRQLSGKNWPARKCCQFFLGPGMPVQKRGCISPWRLWAEPQPPPKGGSLPTSKDFQVKTGQHGSAANFFLAQECQYKKEATIAHGVRGPSHSDHLLGASSPTSKDFQGKTGQRQSAANFLFFSAQECQHKKEAYIAHGILGPSCTYHLARASLPTPEGLTGQDASAGQDASTASFAGPPYDCELDEEPTAKDGPKDTVDAADRPSLPSTTKHQ